MRNILNNAITLARNPISDRDFILNFNRAVHILSLTYDTAKTAKTMTVVAVNTVTEYPITALKIDRVLDVNGNNFMYFTVRNNSRMLFQVPGTYTVQYLARPADVTLITATPEINSAYYSAIEKFVAAKTTKDKELSQELMADYVNDASSVNSALRGVTNKYKRTKAPMWR